ncbi:MATE family efflux transporter [Halomonas sp. 18H]|uniref:MATE family efflux transporter n=1 Tax=Halomonas almeriensis TaxID=308163 RepID=UPI0022324E64|nr:MULTISPECIES: MATE family efflux transporter [Halomonas]MCW4151481.1 MATE family efflux transporter [Halomonas sp. 18H]MDN3552623.1 MATE family efflux transporter [Halomonas almeriensis]
MVHFIRDLLRVSRQDTLPLIRLALPICGAQLAQAGMSVVDVMMTGRLSATDLAAVSVGSSLWMPLMLFMTGTLMGLTPVVAHLLGAGQVKDIRVQVHQALWIGLTLGLLSALLLWTTVMPIFSAMGVPDEVARRSAGYLAAVGFGMPGVAVFQTLRSFSDGMNHTRPALWISLVGLAFNIPSNYLLIYGGDGLTALLGDGLPQAMQALPALGAVGCGIATALSMWLMGLAMAFYTRRSRAYGDVKLWCQPAPPQWRRIGELLHVGVPIGVAIFVEVTLFTLIALFIASLGEVTVAAHQVALNYTSLLFMLPLSLGMALTVRVGNTLGQRRRQEARLIAWNGILIAALVALLNCLILWITARPVVALYTHDAAVQQLTLSLIGLAMIFQVSDSLQVGLAGALRGYKDTRVIMLITLLAYWLVGLGGGHLLGMHGLFQIASPMGVHGYWVGLIAGLTVAALLLGERLRRRSKGVALGEEDIPQTD